MPQPVKDTIHKLALLDKMGQLLLSQPEIDNLFRESAQLLQTWRHFLFVMITTMDYRMQSMVARATAGIDPASSAEHAWQVITDGITGEVCRSGETTLINDVNADPRQWGGLPGAQSIIYVPIKAAGYTAGSISIEADVIGAFNAADVQLLETVGLLLGQANRNAELRIELENSRDYFESVLHNAGEAILTFDLEGRIRTWNNAAEQLLGPPQDSNIYDKILDLLEGSPDTKHGLYDRVLSGEALRGLQLKLSPQSDGPAKTLELSMAAIVDGRGARSGISCILRDISEQVRNGEKLNENLQAMQLLNEVSVELTSILDLDRLLNRIAVLLRRVIEYEILGIFIYNPESQMLELKVAIGYAQETVERWRSVPLDVGLLGHAVTERVTMLSTDMRNDPRAVSARTTDGRWTQSEVAVPLVSRDQLLGGLVVESCDARYFKPEHVQILETLASQIAVSIENAQLFEQLRAKEQKLGMDFALARDLQSSMLPIAMPKIQGYEFAALYKPAESLGGDYYDFIWIDKTLLALAIGDVSGKGVAAAMTMAAARSALRFAARMNSSPSQVLYQVNRRLFRDVKKRTFVSLFYAVLNLHTRALRFSNGGHFPPLLLRRDGSIEELSAGGTLIALFDKSRYKSSQVQLRPGDLICLYTDGLLETRNPAEEEFGTDRIVHYLRKKMQQPAKEILRGLAAELRKFSRGAPQHDDITTFLLKVREDA